MPPFDIPSFQDDRHYDDDEPGSLELVHVRKQFEEVMEEITRKDQPKSFNDISEDIKEMLTEPTMNAAAPTTLHLLADFMSQNKLLSEQREKIEALVVFLVNHEHGARLMQMTAEHSGFTPLHLAIYQKNRHLVEWICQSCDNPDEILCIPSTNISHHNCVHLAIVTGNAKLADYVVNLAPAQALAAKDKDGNTCLHLASKYGAFKNNQLQLIETIIERSDHIIRTTSKGDFNNKSLSPYLYHLETAKAAEKRIQGEEILNRHKQETSVRAHMKQRPIQTSSNDWFASIDKNQFNRPKDLMPKAGAAAALFTSVDNEPPSSGLRRQNIMPDMEARTMIPEQSLGEKPETGTNSYAIRPKGGKMYEKNDAAKTLNTAEPTEDISTFLKRHYLRTRGHDAVLGIIYGANSGVGTCCKSPISILQLD